MCIRDRPRVTPGSFRGHDPTITRHSTTLTAGRHGFLIAVTILIRDARLETCKRVHTATHRVHVRKCHDSEREYGGNKAIQRLAVWRSGSVVRRINEVTL